MRITLNGDPVETREKITIAELLVEQKVKYPEYVSVEVNGEIHDREEYPTVVLPEDAIVECLYFMGGGAR